MVTDVIVTKPRHDLVVSQNRSKSKLPQMALCFGQYEAENFEVKRLVC
jgi:hypothetical protein